MYSSITRGEDRIREKAWKRERGIRKEAANPKKPRKYEEQNWFEENGRKAEISREDDDGKRQSTNEAKCSHKTTNVSKLWGSNEVKGKIQRNVNDASGI